MEQKAARTGRPPAFERDAVLQAAMDLFWDHGYLGVGIADLESRTGINRSSLYNSFGSKDALFVMALARYAERLAGHLFAGLEGGSGGLADIESFLGQLRAQLAAQSGRGCFMVNTMAAPTDLQPQVAELARQYTARFLKAARAALGRAAALGEVDPARIVRHAQLLLGLVLGANLLARGGQPRKLVDDVIGTAMEHLRRPPSPGRRR